MFLKLAKELSQIKTGQEDFKVDYFSKQAARDYIHNKIPLNESIKKIASANNLNEEFTKRVCEQANHTVSSHMFESNKDKNFEFPLADWETIIGPQEKIAEDVYSKSPEFYKMAETDYDRSHSVGLEVGNIGAYLGAGLGVAKGFKDAKSGLGLLKAIPYGIAGTLLGEPIGYQLGKTYDEMKHGIPHGRNIDPVEGDSSWERKRKDENDHHREKTAFEYLTDNLDLNIPLKSDPYESILDLKTSLLRERENADMHLISNERQQREIYPQLYSEFKNEIADSSYFKVAQVLVSNIENQSLLERLTYDLLDDNVITEEDFFKVEKLAEVYNEDSRILKLAKYFDNLLTNHPTLSAEKDSLDKHIEKVSLFLDKR